MGGLDARQLLADPEWPPRILSLTTIGTPHLGSSLADFAKLRFGRVWRLVIALGIDPRGAWMSPAGPPGDFIAGIPPPTMSLVFPLRAIPRPENVCWPLSATYAALLELEGPNDGLVSVESALAFGTPAAPLARRSLPTDELARDRRHRLVVPSAITLYAQVVAHLASLRFGSEAISTCRAPTCDPTPRRSFFLEQVMWPPLFVACPSSCISCLHCLSSPTWCTSAGKVEP